MRHHILLSLTPSLLESVISYCTDICTMKSIFLLLVLRYVSIICVETKIHIWKIFPPMIYDIILRFSMSLKSSIVMYTFGYFKEGTVRSICAALTSCFSGNPITIIVKQSCTCQSTYSCSVSVSSDKCDRLSG